MQNARGDVRSAIVSRWVYETDPNANIEKVYGVDKRNTEALNNFAQAVKSDVVKKELDKLNAALQAYYPERDKLINLIRSGSKEDTIPVMKALATRPGIRSMMPLRPC